MSGSRNHRIPCAACRYYRRRCQEDCFFLPYFPLTARKEFTAVHKLFGANNFKKKLEELQEDERALAAQSMQFEAMEQVQQPRYGCLWKIDWLNQQIAEGEKELKEINAELAFHRAQKDARLRGDWTLDPSFP